MQRVPINERGKSTLAFGSSLDDGVYHYSLFVDGKRIGRESMIVNK